MRRNAGFRLEVSAQPIQLFLCSKLNFNEGVGSDQYRVDYHQQFNQIVFDLACLPRVGNRYEYVRQPQLVFRLRGAPQKDRKLHKSTLCEQSPLNLLIENGCFNGPRQCHSCDCPASTA